MWSCSDAKTMVVLVHDNRIVPVKGRYVTLIVRQGKTWLLARVVMIPDPPAPK